MPARRDSVPAAEPLPAPDPPDLDALRRMFREPGPDYSPVPLWWWSGDPLDPARLRWQLDRYVEGGVFNLVVMNLAPTGPLYGKPADDPPFMSDRWWEIFRGVCADARERGVRLWFYDQIGFSGANIQGRIIADRPEFSGWALDRVSTAKDGPATVACPSTGTPIAASWTASDGEPDPVPIRDGVARYDGSGRGRLSLFYVVRRGFDYLDPGACATLIDTIHGEFERRAGEFVGDVIVGSFQDELPDVPTWGARFADAFRDEHGYDLLPWLDALGEDAGDQGRRVRRDYYATRAALAEAAFFRPLFDWHERRGLLYGVDQQGPARAGDPKGGVRIYADYLRTHRWYSAPGSDHHGEAKIHASLAHLYGRPRVWIEAFHSSGWGGTLEETFDWLLPWIRAGANLYDPHATYYSTRGGWFEWAPPSTDWRQPYWRHYRRFADAVARLCQVLSQGHHVCDVGILHPTSTVQSGLGFEGVSEDAERAHAIANALAGRMVWFDQQPGVMDRLGIDYDVLDEASLARGTVEPGVLAVGEERFRTIVLPGATVLEPVTAERLLAFIDSGGEVIAIGALPEHSTREHDNPGVILALRERFESGAATFIPDVDGLGAALAGRDPLVTAPVPTLVRQAGAATLVFVPAAFPGASAVHGNRGRIDFDRARYAERMTVRVRDVRGAPRLWEPVAASERDDLHWRQHHDGVEVEVPFEDGPGVILVWDGEGAGQQVPPRALDQGADTGERVVEVDDTPWACRIEPTLDNRWGDFTHPAGDGPFPLQRWTFEHRADADAVDAWEPVVATFGPHARWVGPAPAAVLRDLAPDAHEWRVAEWSSSRGIHKDPLHAREPIGPSGHVPEEFLHFGQVQEGEGVRVVATVLLNRDVTGWLAVGAAAAKSIVVDGTPLTIPPEENARYGTMVPVSLAAGAHDLDVVLTASQLVTLRASVALVTDQGRYRRPERITVADPPRADSLVRFRRRLRIMRPLSEARIQVVSNGPCRILIDDVEIGRQGGYMPYGDDHSIHPYDITAALTPGQHDLVLEIQDRGRPVSMMVDGVLRSVTAENRLVTDTAWVADRDGVLVRAGIDRVPRNDPAIALLTQRPHPLPDARWLEGPAADDGTVIPMTWATPEAVAGGAAVEWLRFLLPPGTTGMTVPVFGAATVWLDGEEIGTHDGTGAARELAVPAGSGLPRECVMRVETRPGHQRGAILSGPVTFQVGEGAIRLGDWADQGLADYSGAVRYRRTLPLPDGAGETRVRLDLGDVRGTAEATVDGRPVGVRFLAPYRFDLTDAIAPGVSEVMVEVLVTNTLAPYLDAVSPTPFVFEGQKVSGLLGQVRLLIG